MKFFRNFALSLLFSLVSFCVFSLGFLLSLKFVMGNPVSIKNALSQSGIYQTLVQDALKQSENKNNEINSLPTTQPEIQTAIRQAFPPEQLQEDVNQIIDGTYPWIQGKTPTPTFRIDLTNAKQQLANAVADYASRRLSALPPCTPAEVPPNIDIFTLTCLPLGFDTPAAVNQARQDVLNAGGPLKQPVLTPDTLKPDDSHTITQKFANVPRAYHSFILTLYALALVAIITSVAAVYFSSTWRSGLRRLGVTLVTIGISTVLAAWIGSTLLHRGLDQLVTTAQNNQLVQVKISNVVDILTANVRNWWLGYGFVILVIGIGVLIALRFTKPKQAL